MINKKQKTKDIFYNNNSYTVSYSALRHINGTDIVQIDDDLYVYWDDLTKKWIKANEDLIVKYSKKHKIVLNYKGLVFNGYINDENIFEVNNKKVGKLKIEHFVEYDNVSNTWDVLDIDSKKYDKFK